MMPDMPQPLTLKDTTQLLQNRFAWPEERAVKYLKHQIRWRRDLLVTYSGPIRLENNREYEQVISDISIEDSSITIRWRQTDPSSDGVCGPFRPKVQVVRILPERLEEVLRTQIDQTETDQCAEMPPRKSGGRPTKYDWYGAVSHAVNLILNVDDVPNADTITQTEIVDLMRNYFRDKAPKDDPDKIPGDTQLKKIAKDEVQRIINAEP